MKCRESQNPQEGVGMRKLSEAPPSLYLLPLGCASTLSLPVAWGILPPDVHS